MWQRRQSRVTIRANNRRAARLIINYLARAGPPGVRNVRHSVISDPFPFASRDSPLSRAHPRSSARRAARNPRCVPRKGPWAPREWCNIRHSLKYIKIIVPLNHLGKHNSGSLGSLAEIAQPPARRRSPPDARVSAAEYHSRCDLYRNLYTAWLSPPDGEMKVIKRDE